MGERSNLTKVIPVMAQEMPIQDGLKPPVL